MRLLVVIALAISCSGCFVFDELEKGNEILDAHSPVRNKARLAAKKAASAAPAQATAASDDAGLLEQAQQWWRKFTAPKPAEPDPNDTIVACEVGGSTRFTRKSDCRVRGGSFSELAGPSSDGA